MSCARWPVFNACMAILVLATCLQLGYGRHLAGECLRFCEDLRIASLSLAFVLLCKFVGAQKQSLQPSLTVLYS